MSRGLDFKLRESNKETDTAAFGFPVLLPLKPVAHIR